jgi:2-keto-4-pentenoate hydratase/2-oxohepta-3-ene-1,7-dioic acid hydratase in catechol pathway
MRFTMFNGGRLGLIHEDRIWDLTSLLESESTGELGGSMLDLIRNWEDVRPKLEGEDLTELPELTISDVSLEPPLPLPGKIVAAPVNYMDHKQEMNVKGTIADLGVFLKASSSVIGPGDVIEIPYNDRRTDQEGELAFVIGKTARRVSASEALDHVFGYTCLLDISIRGQEDRSTRKSFDTFTPIGPWITTKDEVGDPGGLDLRCWVNEELRQEANTRDLIYGVPRLIEYASSVMTLYPGDIITSGTPAGVGPIMDGDRVVVEIERVGRLEVGVSGKQATSSPKQGVSETLGSR